MCPVVEHWRNRAWNFTQDIFLNNDESNASGCKILLGASINKRIFRNINRSAEDIRRHICNERDFYIEIFLNLCPINCIIRCNMKVIRICRNSIVFRNIIEQLFLEDATSTTSPNSFGFFKCFPGPFSCGEIQPPFFVKNIHGTIANCRPCPTSKKQNLIFLPGISSNSLKSALCHLCKQQIPYYGEISQVQIILRDLQIFNPSIVLSIVYWGRIEGPA